MPLTCPHCQIVQAEGSEACINCGQPLTTAEVAAPPAEASAAEPATAAKPDAAAAEADTANAPLVRRVSWRLPAVIAFCLLLVLTASVFFVAQRGVPRRTARPAPAPPPAVAPPGEVPLPSAPASAAVPVPAPILPVPTAAERPTPKAAPASTRAMPLTVTLDSTREGRHVKVGEDVTLTALARGPCATLTLSYRRAGGPKTMDSFVEGSLVSTTWTPAAPGRYAWTATALGDHKQSAASRRVEIIVDAPAPPVEARAAHRSSGTVARDTAPDRKRGPALTYHVAAAKFPFLRNAVVLADALRRRGYPAVPERMADAHGKAVYVVVTGAYTRPKEARAAALTLQRSGYPAYLFGSR